MRSGVSGHAYVIYDEAHLKECEAKKAFRIVPSGWRIVEMKDDVGVCGYEVFEGDKSVATFQGANLEHAWEAAVSRTRGSSRFSVKADDSVDLSAYRMKPKLTRTQSAKHWKNGVAALLRARGDSDTKAQTLILTAHSHLHANTKERIIATCIKSGLNVVFA